VKEVLPAEQLLPRALAMTADLAAVPTALVRQTKSSMRQLLGCKEHSQAIEFEYQQQFFSLQQDAARQAITELQHKLAKKS
jgi:enoyl-CoA hydratase